MIATLFLENIIKPLAGIIADEPRPGGKQPFSTIPGFNKGLFVENLIGDPQRGGLNLVLGFDPAVNKDFGGYVVSYLKKRANEPRILKESI